MDFFNNHKKLYGAALALFVFLTIIAAVNPAIHNQRNNASLPGTPAMTETELAGKASYIANGCVACHTQQVRNVDMDNVWGNRPGIPADYAHIDRTDFWRNTATLMGTERTGPDLTNIGRRQPSLEWNLLHLYQPRAVVPKSIMPSYKWLFKVKKQADENDVVVNVPAQFRKGVEGDIVATQEALDLVAYLQSLKQVQLPEGKLPEEFLYKKRMEKQAQQMAGTVDANLPDGEKLYVSNCQACHQPNGEGMVGAFPALKGSPIVLNNDIRLFVDIIMNGYNAREEFAVMNAVGRDNELTPEEITAIINHERTSWGNDAAPVTLEHVKEVLESLEAITSK